MKICIIDDEVEICRFMQEIVELEGHQAKTCTTVEDAIKMLKSESFDIVISDLRMPKGGGEKIIRETAPVAFQCKWYFMTGFSDLTEEKAKELGARRIYRKPLTIEQIEEMLRS